MRVGKNFKNIRVGLRVGSLVCVKLLKNCPLSCQVAKSPFFSRHCQGLRCRPTLACNGPIYATSPTPIAVQLLGHQAISGITTQNAHCAKPLSVTPNARVQDSLCAETDLSQNYPSPLPQQPPPHQPRPR